MQLKFVQYTSPQKFAGGYQWLETAGADSLMPHIDQCLREIDWSTEKDLFNGGIILFSDYDTGIVFKRIKGLPAFDGRAKTTTNGFLFSISEAQKSGLNGIWDLPQLNDPSEESRRKSFEFTPSGADYPDVSFRFLQQALEQRDSVFFRIKKHTSNLCLQFVSMPHLIKNKMMYDQHSTTADLNSAAVDDKKMHEINRVENGLKSIIDQIVNAAKKINLILLILTVVAIIVIFVLIHNREKDRSAGSKLPESAQITSEPLKFARVWKLWTPNCLWAYKNVGRNKTSYLPVNKTMQYPWGEIKIEKSRLIIRISEAVVLKDDRNEITLFHANNKIGVIQAPEKNQRRICFSAAEKSSKAKEFVLRCDKKVLAELLIKTGEITFSSNFNHLSTGE